MGCAPSLHKNVVNCATKESKRGDVSPVVKLPRIPVQTGAAVSKMNDFPRPIIFIFGGPGSQKGSVVEELINEYGFEEFNVENTVIENVESLAGSTVEGIVELQDLLKDYDNLITTGWFLSTISSKIATSSSNCIVIDIVPTMSAIQRRTAFQNGEHDEELEKFEKQHKIMFALELKLTDEKVLLGKTNMKEKKTEKHLSPELTAFLKGADEADKGRLEKRYEAYCKCSEPFLNYFQRSKRVIRFDLLTTTQPKQTIRTLNSVLHGLGFTKKSTSIQAILFAQNEQQLSGLDLDNYKLKRIHLRDVVNDANQSLTSMLQNVRGYIKGIARGSEGIVVLLENIKETEQLPKKIIFIEVRTAHLDMYFKRKTQTESRKVPLKSITSTNGEIYLFPQSMPTTLCKKIGVNFGMEHDNRITEKLRPLNSLNSRSLTKPSLNGIEFKSKSVSVDRGTSITPVSTGQPYG